MSYACVVATPLVLPDRARNLAWQAVAALREAEALSGMVQVVSGPSDAAPASLDDFDEWAADFITRSRASLGVQAEATVKDPSPPMQDRLREVARNIRRGAARASEAIQELQRKLGPVEVVKKVWRHMPSLAQLQKTAIGLGAASAFGTGLGLVLLALAAIYVLRKRF